MEKISFSFLIPNLGYNTYIAQCVESILNQKSLNNYEYEIFICDQSNANDYKRIKELLGKYSNKFFLFHVDVKSLLNARFELMKKATKEYIVFIDSDDFFDDDFIYKVSKCIENNNRPDIVIHNLKFSFADKKRNFNNTLTSYEQENLLDYFLFSYKLNSVCAKTFKRCIFNSNDYDNDKILNIELGEDKYFSKPLMTKTTNIIYCFDICSYNYRQNEQSMIHNPPLKNIFDVLKISYYPNTKIQKKICLEYFTKNFYNNALTLYKNYNSKENFKKIFNIYRSELIDKKINKVTIFNKWGIISKIIIFHLDFIFYFLIKIKSKQN